MKQLVSTVKQNKKVDLSFQKKSEEQDRNCGASSCFVLLEELDHKVAPKDSLLILTVG